MSADRVTVHHGDSLAVLADMADASVDAVVTDPPYGLEFMGKEWDGADGFRRSLNPADAGRESVFGRTSRTSPEYRTSGTGQRGKPGIGKRDTDWVSNQGWNGYRCANCGHLPHGGSPCRCDKPQMVRSDNRWPMFQQWCEAWAAECLRVLKPGGHLLTFGGARTWHRLAVAVEDAGFEIRDSIAWLYGSGFPKSLDVSKAIDRMHGAEREVVGIHHRHGGGSADSDSMAGPLGTASELPLTAPATDAARQWSGWGTALKPAFEPIVVGRKPLAGTVASNVEKHGTGALHIDATRIATDDIKARKPGRWPTNVVLDGDAADELDEQSGTLTSGSNCRRTKVGSFLEHGGLGKPGDVQTTYGDTGGASRFFPVFRYQAKAPTRERPKVDGVAHPTVKPLELMRWLVRLVTPPDGLVLDPFAGSGTTVEACLLEGFRVVAIEREADYLPLIQARIARATTGDEGDAA